ncbi:MAG TPA: chemotaxis protein CheW [Gemmatimonadaceae bacterium]|nr:chemotaxis protein CheW [Gemmatimonadaceae bacterium]
MSQQYSTFIVDGLLFGVDVTRVQEVIRFQTMTPVPRAPEVVRGLINLRGQIVTALDLRVRLGLTPAAANAQPMNVVVRTDEGAVAFLVDAIGDVVTVDETAWEPAPATLVASVRELIPGAYKLDDRLLLQLDVDAALGTAVAA